MDKYLITASFRRDGSSRLANHRWSNFASGAFAWRLSEEKFIKNLGLFDNLKLRLSYGQTGNQGVSAYATRSRMTVQQYPINGVLTTGLAEDRWGGPASPNLKWETTNQYNIGLDMSFLKSRINFVVDAYQKETSDLLQYAYIPMSSGFQSIATNYGDVKNKGLEFTGNFLIVEHRDFSWKIDANISINRNEIGGLNSDQFSDVAWGLESMFLRRNGEPIGIIYGYQENGYFDNEAEVRANPLYKNESDAKIKSMIGQIKYKDNNDDGVIDDRDKAIIGNTNPDFMYGITNAITYKDFTLSFFLQGTQGNNILNVNLKNYDMASTTNMPKFVWDNRWTDSNREEARFPRADITYTRSLKASDRYVENGSYLRLKNLTIAYRLNNPIAEIESVNLTFAVNNLFTITKYSWYDPDVNAFGSDVSRRGVDMDSYPSARTFNMGLQVSF
jgi:TonB-linked SusC/RagA family outer membrane protein